MKNEKFEQVLQKDEEVLLAEGVNKKSYFLKNGLTNIIVFGIISLFLSVLFTCFIYALSHTDSNFVDLFLKLFIIIFVICIVFSIIDIILVANNTFFAITNKRIIKRSGRFNNKFIHYSLKNVGTCEVIGSIFDKKGKDGSATLKVNVKDFHTNTDGDAFPVILSVECLNKAYKAYNLLSEQVDGNNESFRVKLEK